MITSDLKICLYVRLNFLCDIKVQKMRYLNKMIVASIPGEEYAI